MTIEEIENELRNELAIVLNAKASTLDASRPLHELGVDSLAFVELIVFIEKKFGLSLLQAEMKREDVESLHAMAACIRRVTDRP